MGNHNLDRKGEAMDALINDLSQIRNLFQSKRKITKPHMPSYAATCDEAIRKLEYYRGYEDALAKFKLKTAKQPPTGDKPAAPIHETVSDFITQIDDINGQVSSRVYKAYCDYCNGKERMPLPHGEFSRQVNRALNAQTKLKRVDNIPCRVFTTEGGSYHQKS